MRDHLQIILGSASPRRKELLGRFIDPGQILLAPVDLDEDRLIDDLMRRTPNARFGLSSDWAARIAGQLARAKMDALLSQLSEIRKTQPFVAITADTLVVLGDQILGKPANEADARHMLGQLSGREHAVITGVCVFAHYSGESRHFGAVEQTQVQFAELSASKIDWYVQTGEPLDKAGAYGIQGYGSALVKRIQGCFYNVMGLPVYRLLDLFEQVELAFPSFRDQFRLLPW
jgi:septum formation protein